MIIFCVFTLYPVFSAIYTSFFNYKPFGSEFIGLQNYIDTLKYSKFNLFYKAARNTLVYTAVVVPLSLLMSFCISVMILPFHKKVQSVFKAHALYLRVGRGVELRPLAAVAEDVLRAYFAMEAASEVNAFENQAS